MDKHQTEKMRRSRIKKMPDKKDVSNRRIRVEKRNRLMIARFYYWTEIRRRRFDDVMKILSTQEFFVEDRTISNALLDFSGYLDELYKLKKVGHDLRMEYPGWDWSSN